MSTMKLALRFLSIACLTTLYVASFAAFASQPHGSRLGRVGVLLFLAFNLWGAVDAYRRRARSQRRNNMSVQV